MAQLVEQLIRNQQVVGSSPISSFLGRYLIRYLLFLSRFSYNSRNLRSFLVFLRNIAAMS